MAGQKREALDDPAVHRFRERTLRTGWMRGSKPAH